jgi:hypothetical protein
MRQDYERLHAEVVTHRLLGTFSEDMYWVKYNKCTAEEIGDLKRLGLTIVKVVGTIHDRVYINRCDNPFTTDGYWLHSKNALEKCSSGLLISLLEQESKSS